LPSPHLNRSPWNERRTTYFVSSLQLRAASLGQNPGTDLTWCCTTFDLNYGARKTEDQEQVCGQEESALRPGSDPWGRPPAQGLAVFRGGNTQLEGGLGGVVVRAR
ncbi:hypothetical protein ANANG_G00165630, partial [Anguilla anguilla]